MSDPKSDVLSIIQSVFAKAPQLDAQTVIDISSLITLQGSSNNLKNLMRSLPDSIIIFLDSEYDSLSVHRDLVCIAKLFRLERHYRKGDLKSDYSLKKHMGSVQVKYESLTYIDGLGN